MIFASFAHLDEDSAHNRMKPVGTGLLDVSNAGATRHACREGVPAVAFQFLEAERHATTVMPMLPAYQPGIWGAWPPAESTDATDAGDTSQDTSASTTSSQ